MDHEADAPAQRRDERGAESGDEEVAREDKTKKGSKADDDRTKLATNDAP